MIPPRHGFQRIIPGNAQHIGDREQQQDAFGFSDIDNHEFVENFGVLAVLADGMGGLDSGREASLLAVRTILKDYESMSDWEAAPLVMGRMLMASNEAILKAANQKNSRGKMGTTIVIAMIRGDELFWISVGDSRVYLFRQGELTQLTEDHNFAHDLNEMVANEEIAVDDAENRSDRDSLTSYLGMEYIPNIDQNIRPIRLSLNDRILLCSDGLYRTLDEEEIKELLKSGHPQTTAEDLVRKTVDKKMPRQDNVTVVIMDFV